MNTLNQNLRLVSFAMLATLLFAIVVSCSSEPDNDDQNKQPEQTKASELAYSSDHPHDESVTDMVKHKFQHQFADQCLEREIRNSPNAKDNKKNLEKTCMCIAEYMMKDLTAVESEKFLDEKKNTRSLQIRFNNAAYFCAKK